MRDDEIEARVKPIDQGNEAVGLGGGRRLILRVPPRLAEILRHAETVFPRETLRELTELRIANRRTHVIIDVIDLEARTARTLNLRTHLLLDLSQFRMVLMERLGRRKEVALVVDERRHSATPGDGSPAVILPLRVQR